MVDKRVTDILSKLPPEVLEQLEAVNDVARKDVTDDELPLLRTSQGGIKQTSVINVQMIVDGDPLLHGKFMHNDFTDDDEIVEGFRINGQFIKPGPINDRLLHALQAYIEGTYQGVVFQKNLLLTGISNVAAANSFNPIAEYLNKSYSKWDHTERFATFLPEYLGVEESDVTELATRIFLTGAVAKIFEKNFKFDFVLDLVGGQGAGKTTLLRKLAVDWYTDQFTDFTKKDDYAVMLRSWIVNDDEMTATNKSRFDELKKFISAVSLEFRKPYALASELYDKHFVIARTTNEVSYLRDKTGERRFLPLLVNKSKQKKHPVKDLNSGYIEQIWGEAMYWYEQYVDGTFTFELKPDEEEMLEEHRLRFMYIDEVEMAIDEFFSSSSVTFISAADLAYEIAGEDNLVTNKKLASRIKTIMDNRRGWEATVKKVMGKAVRGYKKV
ncbi:hypothetical protein WS105_0642 [Weissella ceti]|uniref:VapE domain-containing protein n=1 Tax=Weissella ceti TaxID=759620 RepID=UPI0004F5D959|nr:VapE domain-containing protein [Weissella ceti]AIM64232.1 hypothetical protein WS105_0642 [Weissella ceti]